MANGDDHLHLATVFRLLSNFLTTVSAFAWLRFADLREGHLDRPNFHHMVYLRILIVLSVSSVASFLLSLASAVAWP